MVEIWKDKIAKLDAIESGALFRSVQAYPIEGDEEYRQFRMAFGFNEYGLYVDRGTGSNTPKGNPGDNGLAQGNRRRKKQWFSKKWYASTMNMKEFLADNIGREFVGILTNTLTK